MYGLGVIPGVGTEDFDSSEVQQAGQMGELITGISTPTLLAISGLAFLGLYWYIYSDR